MGTSGSSRGPRSSSPLVPPWADASPSAPLPPPEGQRFRGFRTEFGKAAGSGDGASLRSALGRYARDSTGGSSIGPRRFGPAYGAGADLGRTLGDLQAGGTGQDGAGVDLSRLIGQPLDYAAQEIARTLAPDNADADNVAAAIQEAIAEALPGMTVFDPTAISPDQLVQVMVEFFARILFQEITNTAGDAWNKAPSAEAATQMEASLLELVKVAVDRHLAPRLAMGLGGIPKAELEALQRAAITDVWRDWEAFE